MSSQPNRTLKIVQPNPNVNPASLRYYDPELQNAGNREPFDREGFDRAAQNSRELRKAYLQQLSGLAPRLSKRTYSLLANPEEPLFDSDLLQFSFGDSLTYAAKSKRRRRLSTTVQAVFRNFHEDALHTLAYEGIESLKVNVPTERWFDMGQKKIDNLLAHELTDSDGRQMLHSFLFASGATVSITFERMNWKTQRIE